MAKGMALITGASSGIGAELARLCAADGYGLILVARRTDRLEQLGAELAAAHNVKFRTIAADLAEPDAATAIYRQTSGDTIDILINNAGFGLRGRYDQTEWNAEARLIQVNITALAQLTKSYVKDMVRRGSGRILNVGSTAAFVPGPLMAMYYASKAFVVSFSEALAKEFEGTGVTVTVLCPGPTRTEFDAAAGITDSKLFRGSAMTAQEVAQIGYRAMMAGQAEVIAGARNRWMILSTRLAPRTMLAAIAKRLNSSEHSVQ
uniref:Short-chain dehydrogenase/reductase SDR n=1 Tax=Solibacter usitatus (strain Ellin6076) TaxID=234267 RepID=Q02AD5_SOLUE